MAIAVYNALSEVASNLGLETFEARKFEIATLSGGSIRSVQSVLKRLSEIGIIRVESPTSLEAIQQRRPNIYTLLPNPSTICTPAITAPV